MYKIQYLPIAKQDLEQIILYISNQLNSYQVAIDLLNVFNKSINQLKQFPYLGKNYQPVKPLLFQYRVLIVKKYLVFYVVKNDVVEIHRILHEKVDFLKIL